MPGLSTFSVSIKMQILSAIQALVQNERRWKTCQRAIPNSGRSAGSQTNIRELPAFVPLSGYNLASASPRLGAMMLALAFTLSHGNSLHAQATEQGTEFATDTDSILEQLGDPQNETTTTSKGGLFVKGNISTSPSSAGEDSPSAPVTVLQEVQEKGASTRAFGVVQRQSVAQRANLRILFDTDSASIRRESYPLLRSLGEALRTRELAGQVVAVNGHTDSTGPDDYNLQLSFERARSVRDYLVNREGIDHSQLKVLGFGEGAPLVANNTADNRQKNRRVEIERSN